MNNATVLVVDDSSDIRTVVKYSLLDQGFSVIEASNGYEAIRLARQIVAGEPERYFYPDQYNNDSNWRVSAAPRSPAATISLSSACRSCGSRS